MYIRIYIYIYICMTLHKYIYIYIQVASVPRIIHNVSRTYIYFCIYVYVYIYILPIAYFLLPIAYWLFLYSQVGRLYSVIGKQLADLRLGLEVLHHWFQQQGTEGHAQPQAPMESTGYQQAVNEQFAIIE